MKLRFTKIGPRREKTCLRGLANNTGADQPAHPRSLISAFVIHFHMGQYQLLSVLAARLSPLNIDHSGNLPVEICDINYTEKYTNL